MKNGYIVLISVLIVGAVGLAVTGTLALLGTDFYRTSFVIEQQNRAKELTNACSYRALLEIRQNNYFFGTSSLEINDNLCEYTVLDLGSEKREVHVTGLVDNITQRTKLIISSINPEFTIDSWLFVSDFN